MTGPVEVPREEDLFDVSVVFECGDEPWVATVTAWARDGDEVSLTWDALGAWSSVVWRSPHGTRVTIVRDRLTKASVRDHGHGRLAFHVWTQADGLGGELVVDVDDRVSVVDSLMRR